MAKREKKRKAKRKSYKPIADRLQSKGLADKVLYEPKGVAKMSAVLIDFMEPYVEYAETLEAYKKLVMVSIAAWNASLLPEKDQKPMIKKLVKSIPMSRTDSHDMMIMMEGMMERKKKHFAEYTRAIMDYQVTETRNGYHLSVASTFEEAKTE